MVVRKDVNSAGVKDFPWVGSREMKTAEQLAPWRVEQ